MVDIWHFATPFALTSAGVAVVEQDSPEEIEQCVANVVACTQGFRTDAPYTDFGIPDPLFQSARPSDADAIRQAITKYEPRPAITVTEVDGPAAGQRTITVSIEDRT